MAANSGSADQGSDVAPPSSVPPPPTSATLHSHHSHFQHSHHSLLPYQHHESHYDQHHQQLQHEHHHPSDNHPLHQHQQHPQHPRQFHPLLHDGGEVPSTSSLSPQHHLSSSPAQLHSPCGVHPPLQHHHSSLPPLSSSAPPTHSSSVSNVPPPPSAVSSSSSHALPPSSTTGTSSHTHPMSPPRSLQPWVVQESRTHCLGIFERLRIQREQGRFCDLSLSIQGRTFSAHRCVLASCSPWFDSRLKMRKTMREEIELDPFLDNLEVFYAVLTYFYTGQITIDRANVAEVLRASDVFGVAKLRSHCCEYLSRHFLGPRDVFAAFTLAARYGLPDLLRQSANLIWRGFDQFWNRPEVMDMGSSTVQGLLKARSWPVSQELLLNFITRWVSWHPQVREAALLPLLDYINWQDVNTAFVSQHLDKEELYVSSQDALYNILHVLDRNAVYLGPKWQETFQALQERMLPEQDLDELNDTNSFLTIAINSAVKDLEHSDVDPDWFLQNEPDNANYVNPRSDHSLMPPPPVPPPPPHQAVQPSAANPAPPNTLPPTHPPAPPPLASPSTSFGQSPTAPPPSPSPVLPSRVESGKLEKYGSKTDAPSIDLEIVDQVISEHEQRMMNEEKIRLTSAKRFDPKFRALTEAFRQNSLEEEGQNRLVNEVKEARPIEVGQTTKVVVVNKSQLGPTPPSSPLVPPKQRPRLRHSKCDDYVSPESPPFSDGVNLGGDINDDDGCNANEVESNVKEESVAALQVAEPIKKDSHEQEIISTRPRPKRPRLLDDKVGLSTPAPKIPSKQGHVKKAKLLAEHRNLKQELRQQGGQVDGDGDEVDKHKEEKSPSTKQAHIADGDEDGSLSAKKHAELSSETSQSITSSQACARPTLLLMRHPPSTTPSSRPRLAPIRIRCQFCPDFTCRKRKEMATHVKHEHFVDAPPFSCPHDKCAYQSQRLSKLVAHMETHAAEPALKCPEVGCAYITRTKNRLAVHRLNHDKRHSCKICSKLFPSANAVKLHQIVHSEVQHRCDQCNFTTKYKSHLGLHKRTHEGTAHRCDFSDCTYQTPKLSLLLAHRRAHFKDRCFKCSQCGRGFVERSQLRRHVTSLHSDEMPHECQSCHFKTKRKDKLKAHIKRMHSKKDAEIKKVDEEMVLNQTSTQSVYAEYLTPKRSVKQET